MGIPTDLQTTRLDKVYGANNRPNLPANNNMVLDTDRDVIAALLGYQDETNPSNSEGSALNRYLGNHIKEQVLNKLTAREKPIVKVNGETINYSNGDLHAALTNNDTLKYWCLDWQIQRQQGKEPENLYPYNKDYMGKLNNEFFKAFVKTDEGRAIFERINEVAREKINQGLRDNVFKGMPSDFRVADDFQFLVIPEKPQEQTALPQSNKNNSRKLFNRKNLVISSGLLGLITVGTISGRMIFTNPGNDSELANKEAITILEEIQEKGGSIETNNLATLQAKINYSLNLLDEPIILSSFIGDSMAQVKDENQVFGYFVNASIKNNYYTIFYNEAIDNSSKTILIPINHEDNSINKSLEAVIINIDPDKNINKTTTNSQQFESLLEMRK